MKNTQKTKDYCGIAGTPYVWNSMPLGIKTAPAMWMCNMHDGVENPVTERYQKYMRDHDRLDEAILMIVFFTQKMWKITKYSYVSSLNNAQKCGLLSHSINPLLQRKRLIF